MRPDTQLTAMDPREKPPPADLRAAIDSWQIGLFELDHQTATMNVCARGRELLELPPDEPISVDRFVSAIHPLDRQRVADALRRAQDPGGNGRANVRYRLCQEDGGVRWLESRSETTFASVGGQRIPVVTRGSFMDFTESEELAQALRRNDARLEQALRASKVGLYEHQHNPAMPDPYWSSTMKELLGLEADAKADFGWFASRVHQDDIGRLQAAIAVKTDTAGDSRAEVEYRWHHPDGELRWLLSRGTTYFDSVDGQHMPVVTVGGIMDITEPKLAEAESRGRSAILDATPDFVGIVTLDGELVYLNQAGRAFLGLGPDEDLASLSLTAVHPESVSEHILNVAFPAAALEGSWRGETQFLRHDGKLIPMSQVILPHREADGSIRSCSTIARDLSREKELEEQYLQAQKMEALGRLASGVTHDFNNLLLAIMGFTELAKRDLKPDHRSRLALGEVQRTAEQAGALTRQLLAFGRKQTLQPRIIDVGKTLGEIQPILERLIDRTIQLEIVLSHEPVSIKADPSQIQQILLNLVVNARDAMPRGGLLTIVCSRVTLEDGEATARLQLTPGSYAVIAVSDTGHGMAADVQSRVFEPFFTTKSPGKGTGLGLSTVFGIVRQSGGSVGLESEPGQGTTFKIYVPHSVDAIVASPPAVSP